MSVEHVDEARGPLERWVIATPLPYIGWRTDRCGACGQRFRGKDRRARYEQHWQDEHAKSGDPMTTVSVRA